MSLKNRETFTVIRSSVGSYASGSYVDTKTEITMKGLSQPLSNEQLKRNQENDGKQLEGGLFFHTLEELFPSSSDPLRQADIVIVNSQKYEISQANKWRNHYESIGTLIKS